MDGAGVFFWRLPGGLLLALLVTRSKPVWIAFRKAFGENIRQRNLRWVLEERTWTCHCRLDAYTSLGKGQAEIKPSYYMSDLPSLA